LGCSPQAKKQSRRKHSAVELQGQRRAARKIRAKNRSEKAVIILVTGRDFLDMIGQPRLRLRTESADHFRCDATLSGGNDGQF
jgi:hypothetical protein